MSSESRDRKIAGRDKSRRYRPGNRTYLHNMTTRRAVACAELLAHADRRERTIKRGKV